MNTTGKQFKGKLTEEQQLEVCHQLAIFKTPVEIQQTLKKEYGVDVRRTDIYHYSCGKKWKAFIAAARQEWVKGMVDIPLFHKRSRIEALIQLMERCERDRKLGDRAKREELAARIRQIHEEVDEKHTHFTNITATQYVGVSYEELLKRRDALIERLKHYGGTDVERTRGLTEGDHRSGQAPVDRNTRPGGEGDRGHGGHDSGAEAGGRPSDGSQSPVHPV